jgi:hypothetical protein
MVDEMYKFISMGIVQKPTENCLLFISFFLETLPLEMLEILQNCIQFPDSIKRNVFKDPPVFSIFTQSYSI